MRADADADMGMGRHGVAALALDGGTCASRCATIKYEPTVWGRYAKMLLSSTEFLFIN